MIQIPEIYLAAVELSSNKNHRECQELEANNIELKATIEALKTQLRQLAEKQRLEVLSHPEIAIAIIESYTFNEQRHLDSASRLLNALKQSNRLSDRYNYSQQKADLKESRRLLSGWRSLLERFKADAGLTSSTPNPTDMDADSGVSVGLM